MRSLAGSGEQPKHPDRGDDGRHSYEGEVLKWILRLAPCPPDGFAVPSDQSLSYINRHRIEFRTRERLLEAPAGGSGDLTRQLENTCQLISANVRRQLAAMGEIRSALPDIGMAVVKGFSGYASTGRDSFMRHSWDIDILSDRPYELADTLSQLGFKTSKPPSPHEHANFQRDDLRVEVQKHFPCWSLSELRTLDLVPAHNPGIWQQAHAMIRHEIPYHDLLPHVVSRLVAETHEVLVPNVALSILLCCVHAFRDYTSLASLYGRCKPRVRLGDLADIYELSRDPAFNASEFLGLVDRCHAQDSVEWADAVLIEHIGHSPLASPTTRSQTPESSRSMRFPRHIWGDFLSVIDQPASDIFKPGMPIDTVVSQLGSNGVLVQGRPYVTPQGRAGEIFGRLIIKEPEEKAADVQLRLTWRDRFLDVDLSVIGPRDGRADRVRFDLGSYACEWDRSLSDHAIQIRQHYPCNENGLSIPTPIISTSVTDQDNGYGLRLCLLWEKVPGVSPTSVGIPCMLGVGRVAEGAELVAGTLIPIRLYS